VISPDSELDWSAAPWPVKPRVVPPDSAPDFRNDSGPDTGGVSAMLPSELSLVADDLVAAVRSTRTIVSGSPTRRARQPS
jgi:hypothetical protein